MIRRHLAASVAAVAVALAVAPVHAEPADYANPDVEGSLADHRNLLAAAESDLASAGSHVTLNTCRASADRPRAHPSTTSPTGMEIRAQVYLFCPVGTGSATFALQRVRWSGWQTLTALTLSGATATGTLSTPCRAGTWMYRVAGSQGTHRFHTPSTRETCAYPMDPFSIDAG